MDEYLYGLLYEQEKTYWWSIARRAMVLRFWRKYGAGNSPFRMLDIGCGTGAMLDDMRRMGGEAYGLDVAEQAVDYCRRRGLQNVRVGDAIDLPFEDAQFDLVTAVDVLEHVEDDVRAIAEAYRVCDDEGLFILVVPAFDWLWSDRDDRLQHKRRYTARELRGKIQKVGFEIVRCTYTNLFMFPLLYAMVKYGQLFNPKAEIKIDIASVPSLPNLTLLKMLAIETFLLQWVDFPVGVSLLCVARKRCGEKITIQ